MSTIDFSLPSEMNYAERVATLNNCINVEMSNPSMDYMRNIVLQQIHGDNKAAPNTSCQVNPFTLPVPPSNIPYEANALADPNL